MRFLPSLFKLRILPLVVVLLIGSGRANGTTILFDNFNDNSLNTSLWLPVVPPPIGFGSVAEVNQRLEVTAGPGLSAVVVQLLATLSGNFDMTVSYVLPQGLFDPYHETGAGIMLVTPTYPAGYGYSVARDTVDGPDECWPLAAPCNGYVGRFPYPESAPSNEFKIGTTDTRGALRFSRVGNEMTAWYWNAGLSNWTILHRTTSFPIEPITGVYLGLVSGDPDKDVTVAFDDFWLQADTVTQIPEPSAVLLLGTGLLGVTRALRWRRRRTCQ